MGIVRAVRGVLLAAFVVSTILLGAASFHEMSGSTSGSVSDAHAVLMPHVEPMSAGGPTMWHGDAAESLFGVSCGSNCGSHSLLTVMCVVAGVAMLLLLALPGPNGASLLLTWLRFRNRIIGRALAPPRALSLTQLSVCRT